jgi:hypothetical protein
MVRQGFTWVARTLPCGPQRGRSFLNRSSGPPGQQALSVVVSSPTIVAQSLQDAGVIRYHRGLIHILKPEQLKEASCECYGAISERFVRLFGPRTNWLTSSTRAMREIG